jgi:hypothetical protein
MDLKGISRVFSLQEMMKIFAYVLVFMCLLRLLVHSWCILGAFLVHSDAQEPEGVACTSCSARLQPFQDLPRTHSIYGSASTRGLDRSHSQSCLWRYVPLLPDFPVDWAASKPAISEHFETMHSSTYSLLSQGA